MRIGVVLAGGMSKGFYEIGCLKAIFELFSPEDIACISASSIGSLIAYSFASGQTEYMIRTLKEIDVQKNGRFFPSLSGKADIINKIKESVPPKEPFVCPTYVTVWNYTQKRVEYVSLHTLPDEGLGEYLCGSVAIPLFSGGVKINDCTYFDGAFIDNIPVYPLAKQDMDLVVCIYFDNQNYVFENDDFDRKILKLYNFPSSGKTEHLKFEPENIDSMIEYGYAYTRTAVLGILADGMGGSLHDRIAAYNLQVGKETKRRITGDTIMTNLNKMTQCFAGRNIQ